MLTRISLAFVGLSAVLGATAPAHAQGAPAAPAETREQEARTACAAGRVDDGIKILAELFAQTEDMTYVFNQGRCFQQNGRTEEALTRFREFLRRAGAGDAEARKEAEGFVAELEMTYDDVETLMPTYIAYVWHDSGKTLGEGAGATKIIEPQPSFGMFAWHDGSLNGWRHSFEGQDVTEISPNFYKVSVPNHGSVNVTTRITACEWPLCADHFLGSRLLIFLLFLIILLILIVVFVVIRRVMAP